MENSKKSLSPQKYDPIFVDPPSFLKEYETQVRYMERATATLSLRPIFCPSVNINYNMIPLG